MHQLSTKEKSVLIEYWESCQPSWIGPSWEEYNSQFIDDPEYGKASQKLRALELVTTSHGKGPSRVKFTRTGFLYLPVAAQLAAGQHADLVMKVLKQLFKENKGKPQVLISTVQGRANLDPSETRRTIHVLSEMGLSIHPSFNPWDPPSEEDSVSLHSSMSSYATFTDLVAETMEEHIKHLKEPQFGPSLIDQFGELIGSPAATPPVPEPATRDFTAEEIYEKIVIHPEIRKASQELFRNGHYPESIMNACKMIDVLVRKKSGCHDKDGQALMAHVFGEKSRILKLNELKSSSDLSEQQGFMYLFMGVMTGIRNPQAHEFVELKDPIQTLQYLGLADLLARRIDEARP